MYKYRAKKVPVLHTIGALLFIGLVLVIVWLIASQIIIAVLDLKAVDFMVYPFIGINMLQLFAAGTMYLYNRYSIRQKGDLIVEDEYDQRYKDFCAVKPHDVWHSPTAPVEHLIDRLSGATIQTQPFARSHWKLLSLDSHRQQARLVLTYHDPFKPNYSLRQLFLTISVFPGKSHGGVETSYECKTPLTMNLFHPAIQQTEKLVAKALLKPYSSAIAPDLSLTFDEPQAIDFAPPVNAPQITIQ